MKLKIKTIETRIQRLEKDLLFYRLKQPALNTHETADYKAKINGLTIYKHLQSGMLRQKNDQDKTTEQE